MIAQYMNVLNAAEVYTYKWLKWQILCYSYFTTYVHTKNDSVGEDLEQPNSYMQLVRIWNDTTTLENKLAAFSKVRYTSNAWPSSSTAGFIHNSQKIGKAPLYYNRILFRNRKEQTVGIQVTSMNLKIMLLGERSHLYKMLGNAHSFIVTETDRWFPEGQRMLGGWYAKVTGQLWRLLEMSWIDYSHNFMGTYTFKMHWVVHLTQMQWCTGIMPQ